MLSRPGSGGHHLIKSMEASAASSSSAPNVRPVRYLHKEEEDDGDSISSVNAVINSQRGGHKLDETAVLWGHDDDEEDFDYSSYAVTPASYGRVRAADDEEEDVSLVYRVNDDMLDVVGADKYAVLSGVAAHRLHAGAGDHSASMLGNCSYADDAASGDAIDDVCYGSEVSSEFRGQGVYEEEDDEFSGALTTPVLSSVESHDYYRTYSR